MSDLDIFVTPAPPVAVTVQTSDIPPVSIEIPPAPGVVEIAVPGPQGPQGPPGSSAGDATFVHTQTVASTLWSVVHNLNKRPAVQVFDSAGTQIEGDVTHVSTTTVTVSFTYPFSGVVYLN